MLGSASWYPAGAPNDLSELAVIPAATAEGCACSVRLSSSPYNAEMLLVMRASEQDLAPPWHIDLAFPKATGFFPDRNKASRFVWPHFDRFLDLATTQPTGFRTNHPFYSANLFLAVA
jgi:hypothetical protein